MAKMSLQSRGISPGITATDLERSIRFYVDGLGFSIADKHEVDGQLRFVMLKAGDAELGVGQDDFAKGKDRVKGVAIRLWLTTAQDLELLAEQVKQAGFELDGEVAALPWGPLAFSLTDPDGFMLTVANPR